jgi:hypothetical protein
MASESTPALPAIPAGYGKSCMACSRAKCKCMLRTEGGSCERCHRLRKQCVPMTTVRKRISHKSASSRTAQLEEKLDDLVSILRASHQQPGQAGTPAHAAATAIADVYSQQFEAIPSRLDSLAAAATGSTSSSGPQQSTTPNPESSTRAHHQSDPPLWPDDDEAEISLNKFRDWTRNFPVVYIAPEVTSETLKQNSPFFWMCIMNVTTRSLHRQQATWLTIKKEAANRVLIEAERSMDLLLGLLTITAWATLNAGPASKPFITIFLQMAVGIAIDLGVTRSPAEEQYYPKSFKTWGREPPPVKERTLEERRAMLGLWHLSSVFSSFSGKGDPIPWSSHLEESLEVLSVLGQQNEHTNDTILVTLVRLQIVCDEAHRVLLPDMTGEKSTAPSIIYKKGWEMRVQKIRQEMSHRAAASFVVQEHLCFADMLINTAGVFGRNSTMVDRAEGMYACAKSIRAWTDLFFAAAETELGGLTFLFFIEMCHTQLTLYRLNAADEPSWDKNLIRHTADLLSILDRTADKFLVAASIFPLDGDEDGNMFIKGAKLMRVLRQTWEPVLMQHMGGLHTPNSQVMARGAPSTHTHMVHNPQVMMDAAPSLDLSNAWMLDVFGSWDY